MSICRLQYYIHYHVNKAVELVQPSNIYFSVPGNSMVVKKSSRVPFLASFRLSSIRTIKMGLEQTTESNLGEKRINAFLVLGNKITDSETSCCRSKPAQG